jgi:hypothetical protein
MQTAARERPSAGDLEPTIHNFGLAAWRKRSGADNVGSIGVKRIESATRKQGK